MSASVNSAGNPYNYLQALWQQGTQANSTASTQSDPLSALLSALNGGSSSSSSNSTSDASGGTTASSAGGPQFDPKMLQALFSMQANGTDGDGDGDASGPHPPSAKAP